MRTVFTFISANLGILLYDSYDAYEHQPPQDTYTRITWSGVNRWVDTKNVVDISYSYIVENHLFKDTHIDLIYKDGDKWGRALYIDKRFRNLGQI